MDAGVDRLIELQEERPCLWDLFCKDYRHVREKRERAYEDIENELDIDVNDIKTKIVGLTAEKPGLSSASVESNRLHSFGHLVQQCATSSNNVQHRPTMLDDVGSVWPGL